MQTLQDIEQEIRYNLKHHPLWTLAEHTKAAPHGSNESMVRRIALQADHGKFPLTPQAPQPRPPNNRKRVSELEPEVIRLHKANPRQTNADIADQLWCSQDRVRRIRIANNMRRERIKPPPKPGRPSREQEILDYYHQHPALSFTRIARDLKVSAPLVSIYLKRHGIMKGQPQTERTLETDIIAKLTDAGFEVHRLRPDTTPGLPDLLVLTPSLPSVYLEVKAPHGQLHAYQFDCIRDMRNEGKLVYLVDDAETALEFCLCLRDGTDASGIVKRTVRQNGLDLRIHSNRKANHRKGKARLSSKPIKRRRTRPPFFPSQLLI